MQSLSMELKEKMRCYRKCQLFSRRRQQQQSSFIVALGLFITSLTGFFLLIQVLNSDGIRITYVTAFSSSLPECHCSKSSLVVFNHGECFFNQPACYPGFIGDHCEIELKNETYRSHCPSDINKVEWTAWLIDQTKAKCLQSQVAQQQWNTSCLFLCFYHRLTGVTQIPSIFWHRSLGNELSYWRDNPMTIDDRLYEHVEGFHGYKVIPLKLNSIIEIGAGPFTQIQYLLTPFRLIKQITLIEPNALSYMQMNNCAYRGGHLHGYPVSIISESIEIVMEKRRYNEFFSSPSKHYSAVIAINVVEHVSNAFEYFRGLYDLLEDNGLLIFHERWYDYPQQGDCLLQNAEDLHPIRITKWIIDQFLKQFEAIYINFNRTRRQMHSVCFEQGVYFIGRKKSNCV
ncbi:unnamed protein product [Rotaria magnacalcarata]|uniref:Uncharacterized protein n=2 Tax=Rotaria magnacalcarata TaxID=392030 RepID=A0A816NBW6_9BILA|nr:unnamed protein product [Rotaria magnacalcarata]